MPKHQGLRKAPVDQRAYSWAEYKQERVVPRTTCKGGRKTMRSALGVGGVSEVKASKMVVYRHLDAVLLQLRLARVAFVYVDRGYLELMTPARHVRVVAILDEYVVNGRLPPRSLLPDDQREVVLLEYDGPCGGAAARSIGKSDLVDLRLGRGEPKLKPLRRH